MASKDDAKKALERLIRKSRVHLYKPIQIAEILYHNRVLKDVDVSDLEDYRNRSKKWRDEISIELLGRKCTSSAKFQDNLFDKNAIPPDIIEVLATENRKSDGAVEAFIYSSFSDRHSQLEKALDYCKNSSPSTFDVKLFLDSFWKEPGLKRSIDKIYEIVVYALFSTILDAIELKIELSIPKSKYKILQEFESFAEKVLFVDSKKSKLVGNGKVYRVGVTNAADRGLDMYSNWGPAIQIKHLCLDEKIAHDVANSISCDRIIIVCKDADKDIISKVTDQLDLDSRIQSIVVESELICWYKQALRGRYSSKMGQLLLDTLIEEIELEFPSVSVCSKTIEERHYEIINDSFWVQDNS